MSYLIKDLPVDEQPREKAKKYGVSALSNAELLAIILRCGTKNQSVKEVSQEIINQVGGFEKLENVRISRLSNIKGVGEVKAITLLAAIELGKRITKPYEFKKVQIKETKDVFANYVNYFLKETQEKFMVLFLDAHNYVLEEKVLFIGTNNQSLVHPRDIFREAILCNAVKILCIHNHPSGNIKPSFEDEVITKKLLEAGNLLGMPVVDHVILSSNDYYSFLEHKKGGF